MKGMTASSIAGIFALAAFAVAIVAGMSGGNPAFSTLGRALIAMLSCYPIGFAMGLIAHKVVHEHLESDVETHPVPVRDGADDENVEAAGSDQPSSEGVIVA